MAYKYFKKAIKKDQNIVSPYLGLAELFVTQFDK